MVIRVRERNHVRKLNALLLVQVELSSVVALSPVGAGVSILVLSRNELP